MPEGGYRTMQIIQQDLTNVHTEQLILPPDLVNGQGLHLQLIHKVGGQDNAVEILLILKGPNDLADNQAVIGHDLGGHLKPGGCTVGDLDKLMVAMHCAADQGENIQVEHA